MFHREFRPNLGSSPEPRSQLLSPGQEPLIRNSELTFRAFIAEGRAAPPGAQPGSRQRVSSGQTRARLLLNFAQIPRGAECARDEHPGPVTPSGMPLQEENSVIPTPSRFPAAHAGYWEEISIKKGSFKHKTTIRSFSLLEDETDGGKKGHNLWNLL